MTRRDFIHAGVSASAAVLGGCSMSFEQGLWGECREPTGVTNDELLHAAWEGLRVERVWDVHTHLFGNGRSAGGIWVEPDYDQPSSLGARVRHAFFMNAGCVGRDQDRIDQGMLERLSHLVDVCPPGAKFMLLAFDYTYDEDGRQRRDLTTFSVPNEYARKIAQSKPERFEWIASVHPYRADAVTELEAAKAGGARAVKWLPPTMGIDMRSRQCNAFYDALRKLDLPLLAHVGEEQAVKGAHRVELANPLFLRGALDRGVRVIAAHCATLGESADLDANANPDKAPKASNFALFARLMDDRRYQGLLYGDLSAITQVNHAVDLPRLLARVPDWEGRLLNGSDYPLPGVMPLFSPSGLVSAGLLDQSVVPGLRTLRHVNALAFDLVLKRNLRFKGTPLPASVFETRDFFLRSERPA